MSFEENKMLIMPAVDIRNGKCVQLVQGKPGSEQVVIDNPEKVALSWQEQGAKTVHIIDLDGTIVYNNGEKVRPNFAGIQSLCGDALANPYLEKSVNITMGCDGSRKAADIKDNELAIGISKDRLEEVIESLKAI